MEKSVENFSAFVQVVSKSFQEQLAGNLETLLMLEREKNEALTMVCCWNYYIFQFQQALQLNKFLFPGGYV